MALVKRQQAPNYGLTSEGTHGPRPISALGAGRTGRETSQAASCWLCWEPGQLPSPRERLLSVPERMLTIGVDDNLGEGPKARSSSREHARAFPSTIPLLPPLLSPQACIS